MCKTSGEASRVAYLYSYTHFTWGVLATTTTSASQLQSVTPLASGSHHIRWLRACQVDRENDGRRIPLNRPSLPPPARRRASVNIARVQCSTSSGWEGGGGRNGLQVKSAPQETTNQKMSLQGWARNSPSQPHNTYCSPEETEMTQSLVTGSDSE